MAEEPKQPGFPYEMIIRPLFQALSPVSILGLAFVSVVLWLSRGANTKPVLGEHQEIELAAVTAFIFLFEAGRYIWKSRQSAQSVRISEIKDLTKLVVAKTEGFKGEITIFNIELNTLNDPTIWAHLLGSPGVATVKLYLSAKIFVRLQNRLVAKPEVLAVFMANQKKLKIYPVPIDAECERLAFTLMESTDGKNSGCILFSKAPPFSTLNQTSCVWEYGYFLATTSETLLARCREMVSKIQTEIQKVPDQTLTDFSVSEIEIFNEGNSIPAEEIMTRHGCANKLNIFLDLVTRDGLTLAEQTGPTLKISGTKPHSQNKRAVEVKFTNLEGMGENAPVKPLLLWVPPWGEKTWMQFTESIDKKLESKYRVAHLHYSDDGRDFTFTGAEIDLNAALAEVVRDHRRLAINPNEIVLVGVSVGAFAAAAAAQIPNVKALCLLMPAVDLFDALDSFRRPTELFTRKFYFAKDGFRPDTLGNSLCYFRAFMHLHHVFDLMFRGARRCDITYFRENLTKFISSDPTNSRKIRIGHSSQDSMIDIKAILELVSDMGKQGRQLDFGEIEWFHDVAKGIRYYSDPRSPEQTPGEQQGINNVIKWLKEEALP